MITYKKARDIAKDNLTASLSLTLSCYCYLLYTKKVTRSAHWKDGLYLEIFIISLKPEPDTGPLSYVSCIFRNLGSNFINTTELPGG